jgi:hypothetical protein
MNIALYVWVALLLYSVINMFISMYWDLKHTRCGPNCRCLLSFWLYRSWAQRQS